MASMPNKKDIIDKKEFEGVFVRWSIYTYCKILSNTTWENMTPEEKKKELFLRQKKTLDLFLERNAISKAQYDKSLGDLVEKWECAWLNE